MTAFKRYCINKLGMEHEEKFHCLPYEISRGVLIDSIIFNAEKAQVTTVYNVDVVTVQINRDGTMKEV